MVPSALDQVIPSNTLLQGPISDAGMGSPLGIALQEPIDPLGDQDAAVRASRMTRPVTSLSVDVGDGTNNNDGMHSRLHQGDKAANGKSSGRRSENGRSAPYKVGEGWCRYVPMLVFRVIDTGAGLGVANAEGLF